MKPLTPSERSALRGRAHALKPVVMIGGEGLTPAVLAEIERALKRHELIKIHVAGDDRDARASYLEQICAGTGAQPVQHIGKMLVIFKVRPKEEQEPQRPAAKPSSGRRQGGGRDSAKPASRAHKPIRRGLFEPGKPRMPETSADGKREKTKAPRPRGRPTAHAAHPVRAARASRRGGH